MMRQRGRKVEEGHDSEIREISSREVPVHPYATKLAALQSPMSFRDQAFATRMSNFIIFGSLGISFPIAYILENVLISVAIITFAGLVCFALFLPNWWQREDPDMKWVSNAEVYHYYQELKARRQQSAQASTNGSVATEMPDGEGQYFILKSTPEERNLLHSILTMFDFLRSKKDKDKDKEKKEKEKKEKKDKEEEKKREEDKKKEAEKSEKVKSEDFEVKDSLGKGTFGYVVLCRRIATNKFYAMKIVDKKGLLDHSRVQDVFTERNILTRANHPYLMQLHWTFQSETKVYFVMDYMPGGDLDKYMNALPNKTLDLFTAKLYAMETLLAILFLHENKVIYRDLKPENVLLTHDGHCALADFGLSKDFHNDGADADLRANSFVGSPYYVAPDVLRQSEYTDVVDFWSFGVLLFRMLCGRLPFTGRNMREVFNNILYTNVHFPSSVTISAEAKDLIMRLLTKQPQRRLQGTAVKEHPFWEGISWDDVMAKKIRPPRWTPIPKLEDLVDAAGNLPTPGRAVDIGSKDAAAPLSQGDQQLFGGFSYATEDPLS